MMDSTISEIKAREILDSKGRPTIEVDVLTSAGSMGRSSAPCGTSVGKYEAFVLRDGGRRFSGLGVTGAVRNVVEIIAPELMGKRVCDQQEIDDIMIRLDGTKNKSNLGANTIYSVSVAAARAAANDAGLPLYRYLGGENVQTLPVPMFNMINGGPYSDTHVDFQEFLLIPVKATTYAEALRMSVEVFYKIGRTLETHFGKGTVRSGHYGGYAAPVNKPSEIIDCLLEAVEAAGYSGRFKVGLDCAASHLYERNEGVYHLQGERVTRIEMMDFLESLVKAYPLFCIEDPLEEDDFEGHAELTGRLNTLIVGDDLFVTNKERLEQGVIKGAADAVLFKPNMIGTLSEALDAASFASKHGYHVIPSSRGGGTIDDPIPDVAVANNAPCVKFGAPRTGERTHYHNSLLRIEEDMGAAGHLFDIEKLGKRPRTIGIIKAAESNGDYHDALRRGE